MWASFEEEYYYQMMPPAFIGWPHLIREPLPERCLSHQMDKWTILLSSQELTTFLKFMWVRGNFAYWSLNSLNISVDRHTQVTSWRQICKGHLVKYSSTLWRYLPEGDVLQSSHINGPKSVKLLSCRKDTWKSKRMVVTFIQGVWRELNTLWLMLEF